jgi:hypothetical protein
MIHNDPACERLAGRIPLSPRSSRNLSPREDTHSLKNFFGEAIGQSTSVDFFTATNVLGLARQVGLHRPRGWGVLTMPALAGCDCSESFPAFFETTRCIAQFDS